MKWTNEHEAAAFEAFWDYKEDLKDKGIDIGDQGEDWLDAWKAFKAGYQKALKDFRIL